MDSTLFDRFQSLGCSLNIGKNCPGKTSNNGTLNLLSNIFYSLKIPTRRGRKTGLDYINAKFFKLPGNLKLFFDCKTCSGRLLPISRVVSKMTIRSINGSFSKVFLL